jgi:hypothetical protein
MAWPDLTLVPEGAITHLVWSQDYGRHLTPVRFASDGSLIVRSDDLRRELAVIVGHVIERLAETALPKTPLAEEWAEIANTDVEEQAFCETAARLGLDPYSIDDPTAAEVINIADQIPAGIIDDFFDSADANALVGAAEWARRAMPIADRAADRAHETLQPIRVALATQTVEPFDTTESERPWTTGYAMARQLRHALGVADTSDFDIAPWVGVGDVSAPAHGIGGFVAVSNDRCGVVLGGQRPGTSAKRFGQARALGRILARPERRQFILSAARSRDERVARAFAAELLAPAEGIRQALDANGKADDSALEAVAQRFRVSPLLVRHQYDNQIAASARRSSW